jgi:hypothetical protein
MLFLAAILSPTSSRPPHSSKNIQGSFTLSFPGRSGNTFCVPFFSCTLLPEHTVSCGGADIRNCSACSRAEHSALRSRAKYNYISRLYRWLAPGKTACPFVRADDDSSNEKYTGLLQFSQLFVREVEYSNTKVHKSERNLTEETKIVTVTPNIRGSLVWYLLCITLVAP